MGALGNTPRRETVISLEARKSFAFGLNFLRADTDAALDLTGATVRLVLAQPPHKGGAVLLTKTATLVDAARGVAQFELQASELALVAGEYPYSVTLVSANAYSSLVMKGVVDVQENPDATSTNVYAGINPSTSLAVYVEQGDVVEVHVDKVDGMYVIVSAMIADTQADLDAKVALAQGHATDAGTSATNAATSATNASASASSAANAVSTVTAARDAAQASATTASTKASEAATSATSASSSATSASSSASSASTSATNASGSAAGAATSASEASGSASAAATSATNASASATSASGSATTATNEANRAKTEADRAQQIVSGDLDTNVSVLVNDPVSATNNSIETLIGATAPKAHTHAQADVTGLAASLAGKSDTGHTHTKANITDFAHTHTKADVTDFAHTHHVNDLTATGVKDGTKFLRDDNTWAAPPEPPSPTATTLLLMGA